MKFQIRFMLVISSVKNTKKPLSKLEKDGAGFVQNFESMIPMFPKETWIPYLGITPRDITCDEDDDQAHAAGIAALLPNGWSAVVADRHHCCGPTGCKPCKKGRSFQIQVLGEDQFIECPSADNTTHRLRLSFMAAVVPQT